MYRPASNRHPPESTYVRNNWSHTEGMGANSQGFNAVRARLLGLFPYVRYAGKGRVSVSSPARSASTSARAVSSLRQRGAWGRMQARWPRHSQRARRQETRMAKEVFPGITIDPQVVHGRPVVAETRVPVEVIVGELAGGSSFDDVMQDYH